MMLLYRSFDNGITLCVCVHIFICLQHLIWESDDQSRSFRNPVPMRGTAGSFTAGNIVKQVWKVNRKQTFQLVKKEQHERHFQRVSITTCVSAAH